MIIMGGNPAEAHPVSLQHVLTGKERNRAKLIVIDPRYTRTAAHATDYIRMRPGTDIPIIWGLCGTSSRNGWEDKEFIRQRVYGHGRRARRGGKWHPAEVERVTGIPEAQLERNAADLRDQKPGHADLVHGRHPEDGGHRPTCAPLHPAPGPPAMSGSTGHGAEHLPRPLQRAGRRPTSASMWRRCPAYYGIDEVAWPTGARLGSAVRERGRPLRQRGDDGGPRHPDDALLRRRDAAEGPDPAA
jgi:formate dehydrogenase major subunit